MKRPSRHADGYYHIDGQKYKELFGSRIQVWNKTAYKTAGLLTRSHLMMNKNHRIVSMKKHKTAKKEKRLEKHGYFAQKGKFGYVKRDTKKRRKSMKKGGAPVSLSPASYEGLANKESMGPTVPTGTKTM